MISVILPTYELADSVLCCLAALENQILDAEEWELCIVDDSEGDEVAQALEGYGCPIAPLWKYVRSSPPRVGRFTASRARNIGIANTRGELLVFIDQDILLSFDCLARYERAYERYGDEVVYVGLYHWMRRIEFTPEDVRENFNGVIESGLGMHETYPSLPMDVPGLQGRDMREQDFGDIDKVVDDAALGAFSGNIGYPRELLLRVGGWDEAITKHGGEDADLGLTVKAAGAKFLLWNALWGVHRWHSRDQAQNALDVQNNIDYIDRKHGIGKYDGAHKWTDACDWSDETHYMKAVGGVVMQEMGSATIWVCRDGHRIGLPDVQAFYRLGFEDRDVVALPNTGLSAYKIEGVANGN